MKCRIDYLPLGVYPVYSKKLGAGALCLGEEGSNILIITKPPAVVFPLWFFTFAAPSMAEVLSEVQRGLVEILDAIRSCMAKALSGQDLSKSTLVLAYRAAKMVRTEHGLWETDMWLATGVLEENVVPDDRSVYKGSLEENFPDYPGLVRAMQEPSGIVTEALYEDRFPFETAVGFPAGGGTVEENTRILREFLGMKSSHESNIDLPPL